MHEPLGSPQATFGGTQAARVALVTGAGRGIGRAIALGLGRAGVSVALLGRSPDALEQVAAEIASYGVAASWAGADVRDYIQIGNAVERLESAIGEIDLLVNNAGVIEPVEVPVWEAGPETWWHVVETDLRGPFHCVRAVVPGMIERGAGASSTSTPGSARGTRTSTPRTRRPRRGSSGSPGPSTSPGTATGCGPSSSPPVPSGPT